MPGFENSGFDATDLPAGALPDGSVSLSKLQQLVAGSLIAGAGASSSMVELPIGTAAQFLVGGTLAWGNTLTTLAIATAQTAGLTLANTTAALVGAQVQRSPMSVWSGTGWKTDAAAASQAVAFAAQVVPVAGTAAPTGSWILAASINGGAYSNVLAVTSAGVVTLGAALPVASGGTGIASYAIGDILYASAATTLSKLAGVETGNLLVSGGVTTAPAWSPTVTLGKLSTTTGSLTFAHASVAFATTLRASAATAASITYVLPVNKGAAGTVLTDAAGDGVLSWASAAGGVTSVTGTALQITVTGTTTPTLSLPAAVTLPGSLTVTTSYSTNIGVLIPTQLSSSATTLHIGVNSGAAMANGAVLNNTLIGNGAGNANISAADNTFVGYQSGYKSTGQRNVYVGTGIASTAASSGTNNTAMGYIAMRDFTSGSQNVAIGYQSGYSITSGGSNIAIGVNAWTGDAGTGSNNLAIGSNAVGTKTQGGANIIIGGGVLASTLNYVLIIGPGDSSAGATGTASNEAIFGSGTSASTGYSNFYLGYGKGVAANVIIPTVTLRGSNGNGTDQIGGTLAFAGGLGTGAGASATLIFQTPTILGTGTTAQTLATHLTVGGGALTTGIAPITIANAHLVQTQTTAPTTTLTSTTLNAGAGSGASITVAAGSTDNAGAFTITAGNGVPTAGVCGQIVFNAAFGSAPKAVQITAADTAGFARFIYIDSVGTASFEINADVAFVSGSSHTYYYWVMG